MVGIIDIGSNTIRLVVYEKGQKISNIAVTSEILHDTVDGTLTDIGTQKLCDAIQHLKNQAKGMPVFAIATFAFRVLDNCEEVKQEILQKTGVEVEILSGKDEAKCDFAALRNILGNDKNGIGVDLGGGSAQIFNFCGDEIGSFDSYPIGAKKIKKIFTQDAFPTEEEKEKIIKYIKKYIKRIDAKSEIIYMMGGTSKTALRIYSYIKGTRNIKFIPTEALENIISFIKEAPEELIKNAIQSRYDNIVCGIMVMEEIAKMYGAEKICVLPCGVREGYISLKGIE